MTGFLSTSRKKGEVDLGVDLSADLDVNLGIDLGVDLTYLRSRSERVI